MTSDTSPWPGFMRSLFVYSSVLTVAIVVACGSSSSDVESSGQSSVEIGRIADGDSLVATGPAGEIEIRLLGINSPELNDCLGEEAKEVLEDLLSGDEIVMTPWPADRDRFGRHLVFLEANGSLVNREMVERGFAIAGGQGGDHRYEAELEAAEARAMQSNTGIWAPDACGPAAAMVRIVEVQADAPGYDFENPNGEWVLVANEADSALDLSGWSLRDESTGHRFDFPDVQVGAGLSFRVRTGCGIDDLTSDPLELYWCDPNPPVWNNDGDTAILLDPNGSAADHFRTS